MNRKFSFIVVFIHFFSLLASGCGGEYTYSRPESREVPVRSAKEIELQRKRLEEIRLKNAERRCVSTKNWETCYQTAKIIHKDRPSDANKLLALSCYEGGHDQSCDSILRNEIDEEKRAPFDSSLMESSKQGCNAGSSIACQHVQQWSEAQKTSSYCAKGETKACQDILSLQKSSVIPSSALQALWEQACASKVGLACHEIGQSLTACQELKYSPACSVLAEDARSKGDSEQQLGWLKFGCSAGDSKMCQKHRALQPLLQNANREIKTVRKTYKNRVVANFIKKYSNHCCDNYVKEAHERNVYLEGLLLKWNGIKSSSHGNRLNEMMEFMRQYPKVEFAAQAHKEISQLKRKLAQEERQRKALELKRQREIAQAERKAKTRERERERALLALKEGWVSAEKICSIVFDKLDCLRPVTLQNQWMQIYWAGEITALYYFPNRSGSQRFSRARVRITWSSERSNYQCGHVYEFKMEDLKDFTRRSFAMWKC